MKTYFELFIEQEMKHNDKVYLNRLRKYRDMYHKEGKVNASHEKKIRLVERLSQIHNQFVNYE